ncbi:MAG: hypothetical protein ACK4NE_08395 [Albidovulum sp.]
MSDIDQTGMIPKVRAGQAGKEPATPLNLDRRARAPGLACGGTPAQRSDQLGLARSTVSKVENGRISPDCAVKKKPAAGLAIPVPGLFAAPSWPRAAFQGPADPRWGNSAVCDSGMGHNVISPSPEDATILRASSLD